MAERTKQRKVLIVGGGFAGIKTALELAKSKERLNLDITLISDKPHFEYHAALYRVVTGRSPLEVCIPLSEILPGRVVKIVEDCIVDVDLKSKRCFGQRGISYSYDFLVLALGAETSYFDIPGLREFSFGMKSINEALRLKQHLHELFTACSVQFKREGKCAVHLVVVGGGASGVELSGELATYARRLALQHQIDPYTVTIDLFEAAERLLPNLPPEVSSIAYRRLHHLGVNIFVNSPIRKEKVESVMLKDMELKTQTVIWTAGVKPNKLYGKIKNLELDKHGRAIVDLNLNAVGWSDVYVVGDAAATRYSGMAQTALRDGEHVARNIRLKLIGKPLRAYRPSPPAYSIPIGPGWALFVAGRLKLSGVVGWWMRRWIDLSFFLSILPPLKAYLVFRSGRTLCETCSICSADTETNPILDGPVVKSIFD